MNFKKNLKSLPIEVYVLAIIPILLIVFSWVVKNPGFTFSGSWFKNLLSYIYIGGIFLITFLIILSIFIIHKIFFWFLTGIFGKKSKEYFKNSSKDIFLILKHYFYFLFIILSGSLFSGIFLGYLYSSTNISFIANTTNIITQWDYFFFDGYSFLKAGDFIKGLGTFFASSVIFSYEILPLFIPIIILIFIIFNKKIAKKFLIFSFLIGFLSFPLWFNFPIVTPYEMYILNALNLPQSASIESNISWYKASPGLDEFWEEYEAGKKASKDSFNLSLTGFPSMHAGWGAGMVYYGMALWPPLGIVLLVWFILQVFGAVYIGIHYGIDMILGVIMAIITILLVELFLFIEKKYYTGKESLMIIDIIQEDFKKGLSIAKENFLKLKEIIFKK